MAVGAMYHNIAAIKCRRSQGFKPETTGSAQLGRLMPEFGYAMFLILFPQRKEGVREKACKMQNV